MMHICDMNYDDLARDLMRALRGERSQIAFSRRLGYSSNVAYAWESGRRFPTGAETLRIAMRVGLDVRSGLGPFFQRHVPDELKDGDPASPAFVAALLRNVRGTGSMQELATRAGLSRSAISRILAGETEPRLPMFLRLIDVCSRRLLDLLASLVDVGKLPAAGDEWRRVEALRRLAFDNPLSEAVPRFLELDQYAEMQEHRPGWIAERLGISQADEDRTLRDLETAGVIRWSESKWVLDRSRSIDTTRDPLTAPKLREHWTNLARTRIAAGAEGLFSYLVFSTDDETLAAIQELRLRFFRELRTLVGTAKSNRRVAVANVHLFPIDIGAPE